jgi:hypothetical protein
MHHAGWIVFGVILAALVARPSSGQGGAYDLNEIIAITKELGKSLDWPDDKVGDLVANIKKAAQGDIYKQEVAPKGVVGVFVYRATEAGLILKVMRGSGLVTFKGGRKAAEITLRSTSVGAHIGGSAEWGAGLIVGLKKDSDFGGEYSGSSRSAVAIDESSSYGALLTPSATSSTDTHAIFVVITGRGLSAGTGGTKLTITTSW